MTLLEIIQKPAHPLVCLEVNPPRGADFESVFSRLEGNVDGVDFFNVTDCALAKMRCAALPFAALLKQRFGIETLVNVACRDRNVIALQSDLLAGWAMGIRSIVALTGDAVTIGDHPEAKGVFEFNSVGLLRVIETLNGGHDMAGGELRGVPALIPGVVVNPNVKNPAAEIRRLAKKGEAGGVYALSQPVFETEQAVTFFEEAKKVGVALFVGLLPFKNVKAALGVSRIPGIRLSERMLASLDKDSETDISAASIEHCVEIAQAVRPHVAGFHVICGATPKLGLQLVRELVKVVRA